LIGRIAHYVIHLLAREPRTAVWILKIAGLENFNAIVVDATAVDALVIGRTRPSRAVTHLIWAKTIVAERIFVPIANVVVLNCSRILTIFRAVSEALSRFASVFAADRFI